MMAYLKGSANYVWCTTSVLGKGATGSVYQGVNKHNGEAVAVKTFNPLSHTRPLAVQMREFEVLQKVKHANIVTLLAIEEDQEFEGKVIVMELCTGGSLFNLLDDPENSFGMVEEEWCIVLRDLSAGMKHLRDNSLVHRDLKPGNIMKCIGDDGSIVYKLTDFGAARELLDDQQFVSLYGTEEYLHPDMYERAVLRKSVTGKTFDATVDLWSIGVTLYHSATGNLPFRPFGGRRNKETMYYITTKKASGVISGVQTSENGPIQWGREMPKSCLLSNGLKRNITNLLAGVLEVDPTKMWTFERFFSEVTKLLAKKRIHVFYLNNICELKVFLDNTEHTVKDFKDLIKDQTGVAPSQQLLFFRSNELSHYINSTSAGKDFPETSSDDPIFLYNMDASNVFSIEDELPTFPSMPNIVSVENDASVAKLICGIGFAYCRKAESLSHAAFLMDMATKMLCDVISLRLNALLQVGLRCQKVEKFINDNISCFKNSHEGLNSLSWPSSADNSVSTKRQTLISQISSQWSLLCATSSSILPSVHQLQKRFSTDNDLLAEWKLLTKDINGGNSGMKASAVRSRTYANKLRESWQHLMRDRQSRTLTYNDEQFHILEKIKITEKVRALASVVEHESFAVTSELIEALSDWCKLTQAALTQEIYLQQDMFTHELNLDNFRSVLNDVHAEYDASLPQEFNQTASSYKTDVQPRDIINSHTSYEREVEKKVLKSIIVSQDEIWGLLHENTRLVEQFGYLTKSCSIK